MGVFDKYLENAKAGEFIVDPSLLVYISEFQQSNASLFVAPSLDQAIERTARKEASEYELEVLLRLWTSKQEINVPEFINIYRALKSEEQIIVFEDFNDIVFEQMKGESRSEKEQSKYKIIGEMLGHAQLMNRPIVTRNKNSAVWVSKNMLFRTMPLGFESLPDNVLKEYSILKSIKRTVFDWWREIVPRQWVRRVLYVLVVIVLCGLQNLSPPLSNLPPNTPGLSDTFAATIAFDP